MSSAAGGRIAAGVGANLIGQHAQDRNQEATVYVGNLDAQLTEELVWELFGQAGPLTNVYLPKDRVTSMHQGYGFVEFKSEDDADYAIKVLNMVKVWGKPIRVNKASQDKKTADVGANLFIGGLDSDVDEKLLYDTFSAFGQVISTPKIMRDPDTGRSRGFGFVSYDSFEAADAAIAAMNGQFLCNQTISVTFAYKKDKVGERHGTPAERQLAAQRAVRDAAASRPHTRFATGPQQTPQAGPPPGGMGMGGPPPPPRMDVPVPPPPNGYSGPSDGVLPPPQPYGFPPHGMMAPRPPQGYGMPQLGFAQPPWGQQGGPPPPLQGWGMPFGGMPRPPQGYGGPPGMPPPPGYGARAPMGMPRPPFPPQGLPPPPTQPPPTEPSPPQPPPAQPPPTQPPPTEPPPTQPPPTQPPPIQPPPTES